MVKRTASALSILLLASSTLLASESAQSKKWREFFVGEWSRETEMELDGNTTKSTQDWTCEAEGTAILATGELADGDEYSSLMLWDGVSESLLEVGTSANENWTIHFKVIDGKKLSGEAECCLTDGRKGKGTCTITRTGDDSYDAVFRATLNDGSKFVVTDSNQRKQSLHEDWLNYMAGEWTFTLGDGIVGVCTWARSEATPALLLRGKAPEFEITGVFGWSHAEHVFQETDFAVQNSVPEALSRRFDLVTPEAVAGVQTWRIPDGGQGKQRLEYRRLNANEMTLTGKASDAGGTDWSVHFERVKERSP